MRVPLCLLPAFGLLVVLMPAHATAADPVRVEVSRDAWISAYPSEQEGNNGGSPKLKLKGIQEFFLIDFEPLPYAGRTVAAAELHLHGEGAETLGRVSVSSIVAPWQEGTGSSYDKEPGASSFLWAANGQRRWAPVAGTDGPDITGIVLGLGGSVWGFADATPRDAQGWQTISIDPAVVQARLDGDSYGFFVIDDVGNEYTRDGNHFEYHLLPNRFLSSRDSNAARAPYFTLRFAPSEKTKSDRRNSEPAETEPANSEAKDQPAADSEPQPTLPQPAAITAPPVAESRLGLSDLYGELLPSTRLYCARGEAICLFVDASGTDQVTVEGGEAFTIELFDTPEVGGFLDPLVPEGEPHPAEATGKASGKVLVEIYALKTAPAGVHPIRLRVGDASDELSVQVWNFTLPDHLSFVPQMNAYSVPGDELKSMRLAHEHRTTLNQLRYGWSGKVDDGSVPRVSADGSWDWSEWDGRFGPLFDGTAFSDLRRAGVPIEAFYLPLNENWPMDHDQHFLGGYWIENAYDDAYWAEFREASARFARHFQERRWHDTMFEFYLNNKVYFKQQVDNRWDACSAPWIFDEPVNTQDFWALRRFGLEFWRGVDQGLGSVAPILSDGGSTAAGGQVALAFRADISRPEWQRQLLDGVVNVEVVSGALRTYRERVIERARALDNMVYMYGSANAIGTPNAMPAAWCVETWALGGDGVVPWQTMGTSQSWVTPDQLSLFYPTAEGPLPSVRLKSFRAGQQLTEYLTLYCQVTGFDRDQIGARLLAQYPLGGEMRKRSEADAGDSLYGESTAHALETLRQTLGQWLDQAAPPARQRVYDPRPARRDPSAVPVIAVTR